ncbi:MAG: Na/Pi cotransporter family protein [Lautropia sp.]|nr:Na/Pi cotransporter family protein [Lautropia sp.]
MFSDLSTLAGGIGLFLLGMVLMSDSLKALAGESLKTVLSNLTGKPTKALMAGIGATVAVQSSTATTMATIGFVSAGLLSFNNAIGVIIGANIGSTSTGWIVAVLGMKFSISSLAMPILGVGALMKLLCKDRWALFGLVLCGFGLLFVGIDFLQEAMADLAKSIDLSHFSDSWQARLMLVVVGIAMTLVLQASSAAMATTLAALSAGTIDFDQATSLVIGQNIGTTATALLAAVGGSSAAKRTALVHVFFNIGSAVLALLVLQPLFLYVLKHWAPLANLDQALALAAFHTLFSVVGALVFLPQRKLMTRLTRRLVKDSVPPALRHLDKSLLDTPALAIAAAEKTLRQGLAYTCHMLSQRLLGQVVTPSKRRPSLEAVLEAVDAYLAKLSVPQSTGDQQRLMQLLLLMDQTRVFAADLDAIVYAHYLQGVPALEEPTKRLAAVLAQCAKGLTGDASKTLPEDLTSELQGINAWMHEHQHSTRRDVVEGAVNTRISTTTALDQLTAQRWLERLTKHLSRIAETLAEGRGEAATKEAAAGA